MDYQELLPRFAAGTATGAERDAFNQWLETLPPDAFRQVVEDYERFLSAQPSFDPYNNRLLETLLHKIHEQEETPPHDLPGRLIVPRWVRYAAAILLVAGAGLFAWWLSKHGGTSAPSQGKLAVQGTADVEPGKDGAILTLADGRVIVLDSLGNGTIAQEGGANVVLTNGQLAYNRDTSAIHQHTVLYNTMQTPRGRQFQLLLPDGTRVWLNAVSSIRYPIVFTGDRREVTVTGEAYLEVAKGDDKQFLIHSNGITSIVRGTGLNINAYDDEEATRITLVEGRAYVGVTPQQEGIMVQALLLPGEQASFTPGNDRPVVSNVNIEQVVAWKNGVFNFQHSDLPSAMRQIARWYDVEVVFAGDTPKVEFGGKIQRSLSLSQIIKNLGDNELQFKIEDRKLIVMP